MVLVKNLLVVSLTSFLFFTFVKHSQTECITAPPCLKTRVLQSSPLVPQKKCTACEENPSIVETENYAALPSRQEKPSYQYHQQQISAKQPPSFDSDSNYRQKPIQEQIHQPSRYSQKSDCKCKQNSRQSGLSQDGGCTCKQSSQQSNSPQDSSDSPSNRLQSSVLESSTDTSGSSYQSNYYVLQRLTQVINHILQPSSYQKTPQSYSIVPQEVKPIQKKPSYQTQISYPRSSDDRLDEQLNAATPLYHLASNQIERRPYKPSERPNYQPVRQPYYASKPKVSAYISAPSPKATKKTYGDRISYEENKSGERKSAYGRAPTKQSIQISCKKCQKTNYDEPKKGTRIQY